MRSEVHLRTVGADDTRRFAAVVARALRAGDVVSLTGELGAGKTCFVQGAARALGVGERVTSPSFLLRRDYRGDVDVLHLDVYRLESLQEVIDLGFEEAGDGARVTFVEWGDAVNPLLPSDHLEVELVHPPLAAADLAAGAAGTAAPGTDAACTADGDPATADGDPAPASEEVRLVRLRAHGDDWKRRLPTLAVQLGPWLAPSAGA